VAETVRALYTRRGIVLIIYNALFVFQTERGKYVVDGMILKMPRDRTYCKS
jgi:hypothetical protein